MNFIRLKELHQFRSMLPENKEGTFINLFYVANITLTLKPQEGIIQKKMYDKDTEIELARRISSDEHVQLSLLEKAVTVF